MQPIKNVFTDSPMLQKTQLHLFGSQKLCLHRKAARPVGQ
ncbi:hypothetical protein PLUTE_a0402 [Pseudoalteromonas luteoviolacea DSM 6061]|nr:hypothetical protein [Pseudoalteromonas luteoviolacea DSM 6061]